MIDTFFEVLPLDRSNIYKNFNRETCCHVPYEAFNDHGLIHSLIINSFFATVNKPSEGLG